MAKYKINEAVETATTATREASLAVIDSTVAIQERNMEFVQSSFEKGIEVLKKHAEEAGTLVQQIMKQPTEQQRGYLAVIDSIFAAQERNMKFAQSIFMSWMEVLKGNTETTYTLTQELEQQAMKQYEAFQMLAHESMNTYIDFFRAPFSYYQQMLHTAQTAMEQGRENSHQVTPKEREAALDATK